MLAFLRRSDDYPASADAGKVKGMKRLSAFHENVVGHVDHIGNGTDTAGAKAVTQGTGALCDLDAGDDPAEVPVAQLGIGDLNRRVRSVHMGKNQRTIRNGHGQIVRESDFTGETDDGQAVAAVGRYVDVEHVLFKIENIHKPVSGLIRVGEDKDAVMIFAQTKLAFRADHAEGRLAAELCLLDDSSVRHGCAQQGDGDSLAGSHVGGAADDIRQFSLSRINLADMHVVGIGMGDALDDLAHDDGIYIGEGMDNFFQLQSEHGQPVRERLGAPFIGNKFA